MKLIHLSAATLLLLGWVATFSGCNQSSAVDTQQVQKYRTSFALDQEPDGAETVLAIRESLSGGSHADEAAHHEEGEAEHDHSQHGHGDAEHAEHHDHSEDDHAEDGEHDHAAEAGHDEHADHDEHAHHEESQGKHDHGEHAEPGHEGHDHAAHDHAGHDHAAHASSEPRDVVMVGMVGGLPNAATQTLPEFPFVKDYAIVMVADPLAVVELEEGGHNHAPGEECAFCAAHAGDQSNFLATVKFTGDDGKVLSIDARELFDLKEKDIVVVRGKARLDHDGTLVVDATGLYVRR